MEEQVESTEGVIQIVVHHALLKNATKNDDT